MRPITIIVLIVMLVMMSSLGFGQSSMGIPGPLEKFLHGVYFPFERLDWVAQRAGMGRWVFVDRLLSEMRHRYHIDALWVVNISTQDARQLCRLAEKHRIGVLITPEPVVWWRHLRGKEAAEKIARSSVDALKDLPALWGYVLIDEGRSWEMVQLELVRQALSSLDNKRVVLMVTMTGDTESAARYTNLPILVTDIYPFFGPKSPNGPNTPEASRAYYITCTERLKELAQESGKLFWVMPQGFAEIWGKWHYDQKMNAVIEEGAYWHWRMPSVGEVRWQIWQAILSGAKGVVFFVLFPTPNDRKPGDPSDGPIPTSAIHPTWSRVTQRVATNAGTGLLYNDGSPTEQFSVIAESFQLLKPYRDLLWRMQPHLPIALSTSPFRTATFIDPVQGNLLVAIVNDDTDRARDGTLTLLLPTANVDDLLHKHRLRAEVDHQSGFARFTLTLEPGAGTLLLVHQSAAVGLSPIFFEDVAVGTTAGQWHQLERALLPVGWGMGYRIVAKPAATNGQAEPFAYLQYDLSTIAADWRQSGGHLIFGYEGNDIEVWVSSDGFSFTLLQEGISDAFTLLPPNATHLRIVFPSSSSYLRKCWLWHRR
ncbi:MAG: hypothetical protein RMK62_08870 [Armatimonadota bacterium]|nr:hypothetical protein [Armatimonadota bacterium]